MDDALTRWRQQGRIYLWRYTAPRSRKLASWHFAADRAGRDSLVELLDLQLSATWPGPVGVKVTPHLERPQPANYDAPGIRWRSPRSWRIDVRTQFAPECWSLSADDGEVAILQLGRDRLREFRDAVADLDPMAWSTWDYSMGDEDEAERLWIWPPPPGTW